jgi:hypothetical protein
MSRRLIILCLLLLPGIVGLKAQNLAATGFFQYKEVPLGTVLSDISRDFHLRFSYSPDVISLNEKINLNLRNARLEEAMTAIYDQTGITYQPIGGNLVLKKDPNWARPQLISKKTKKSIGPTAIEKREPVSVPSKLSGSELQMFEKKGGGNQNLTLPQIKVLPVSVSPEKSSRQLSLVPYVGINAGVDEEVTHNLSVNVLWGMSGSVDGVEVGGFANTVLHNMNGIQISGFLNSVGGITEGTQLAGAMNMAMGEAEVSQGAGLMNIAAKNLKGSQVAGIGNLINGDAEAIQLGGLFNVIGGDAPKSYQMATIFNHQERGRIGYQVAGLINVADTVEHLQLGMVNFADTIAGASLGLWTFVENGYKPWSVGIDEMRMVSLAKKSGNHNLYNHFEIAISARLHSWSFGYGLGTAPRLSDKWRLHIEAISNVFHHRSFWRSGLNLRNQIRFNFAKTIHKDFEWYGGFNFNVFLTNQRNSEGQFIIPATKSPLKSFSNNATHGSKVWIGLETGVRF